jgi:hypothetical protein
MSRLAREMKIYPYEWNVAIVVSAVMEKDRQDASRKRRAFARVGDPRREVKMAWGIVKSAALGTSKPPLGAKSAAPSPSKPLSVVPAQERSLHPHRVLLRRTWGARYPWIFPWMTILWAAARCSTPIQGGDLLVSFFWDWVFDKTMVQDRRLGNWLLSRRRWRLGQSSWRLGRRGLRRTHGPCFAPAARSLRPPPLRTWRAQLGNS